MASGCTRNGVKQLITQAFWVDLYPMFATDKIIGRTRHFTNIEVYGGGGFSKPFESQLKECIAWLKGRRFEGEDLKEIIAPRGHHVFWSTAD